MYKRLDMYYVANYFRELINIKMCLSILCVAFVAFHIMLLNYQNKHMGSVPSSYGDILTMNNKIILLERNFAFQCYVILLLEKKCSYT